MGSTVWVCVGEARFALIPDISNNSDLRKKMNKKKHKFYIARAQKMASVIWARAESKIFRLQPLRVVLGPVGSRVMGGVVLHGGSCLNKEERVYAVEVLRLGVGRFTSLFRLFQKMKRHD